MMDDIFLVTDYTDNENLIQLRLTAKETYQ